MFLEWRGPHLLVRITNMKIMEFVSNVNIDRSWMDIAQVNTNKRKLLCSYNMLKNTQSLITRHIIYHNNLVVISRRKMLWFSHNISSSNHTSFKCHRKPPSPHYDTFLIFHSLKVSETFSILEFFYTLPSGSFR